MSYFYGTTTGGRSPATRCGTKTTGITSTANSYTIGGEVEVTYSERLDADIVSFFITRGSHTTRQRIAAFTMIDGKRQLLDTIYPELFI